MTIRTTELATDLERAYFDYAVETITDRALPRVEDGLKPVQRRILYAMHDMGLLHDRPHKKSARVVGEVLGKYHPHGDSSVYMAMVRMAQDFSMRHPLVDGQGNFGTLDGDSPAAMRYTEVRMTELAGLMLADIKRDTVPWQENFDGSLKEPEVLPTVFPNLLVNGSSGVAVGMATNIPPHNLGEVCDALMYVTRNWEKRDHIPVHELIRFIPGPDFPTGGVIYRHRRGDNGDAVDVIQQAYETGRGRIVTQARLSIEDIGGGKADIVITELPYTVQKATVLERIGKEVREACITGVTDLRDESDYTGMRVVVEVSRTADPGQVLTSLLTRTQLRETFGVNALALVTVQENGETYMRPRYLSLRDMLVHFIAHRLVVIERRSRYELNLRRNRLHLVEGLLKALINIDEVIATIKKSQTPETARTNLVRRFRLTEDQAEAILGMPLRRLAALERRKLETEREELKAQIEYLEGLLASEAKRLAVVVEETTTLKERFATPRRTVILDDEEAAGTTVIGADLAIPDRPQVVVITTRGVRRVDAKGFGDLVPGVSARPVEAHLLRLGAGPGDTVILVSNRGRAWRAPVGRVPPGATFADLGLMKGEVLVGGGIVAPDYFLIIGTRSGNVKRVRLTDLGGSEATRGAIIGLNEGDEVLFAGVVPNDAQVMFFTTGKAVRFSADQVNPQATPSARGVAGIQLGKGDRLIAGAVFVPDRVSHVVVVSETGFIKRVRLDSFPVQGRGGQGVQSLTVTKATGRVAAAAVGPADGNVDVISARGRRHRLAMTDLPETNRSNRGERRIDFGPDDVIVGVVVL